MTTALIPVKNLEDSKSRLLSRLPDGLRRRLTLAMLEDLIAALAATPGIDRIAVTTPDETVATHARAAGSEVLLRPEPGLNAALEDGRERLCSEGDDLLFVLGDVAGALPSDFARLLEAAKNEGPSGWLAPSADGGTSALLHHPAGLIPCRFGPDSAKRHGEAAADAGIPLFELTLPSLAIDLDQPEDLDAFLATEGGGARTRTLLREAADGEDDV